jgi:hypothetical protein
VEWENWILNNWNEPSEAEQGRLRELAEKGELEVFIHEKAAVKGTFSWSIFGSGDDEVLTSCTMGCKNLNKVDGYGISYHSPSNGLIGILRCVCSTH